MSELGNAMKVVLADTFGMYLTSHGFHWNVEGRNFYQYHKLFQKIYEELFEAVDSIAEHIRALDEYAPFSYKRFQELSTVEDVVKIPVASAMMEQLIVANDQVTDSIRSALAQAKLANNEALVNFLGGRQEAHDKHGWMLRATTKTNRE